jgi:hypothetical protein
MVEFQLQLIETRSRLSTPVEFHEHDTGGQHQPGGPHGATEIEIQRTIANLRRLAAVRGPQAVVVLCDGINQLVESLINHVGAGGRVKQ